MLRVPARHLREDELLREMLADSPSGLWPLTEVSGTVAYDRSGNGRNGTYTSTVNLGRRVGRVGAADLAGGYVTIPDADAFSSSAGAGGLLTVDAWVRFDTLAAQMQVVSKGSSGQYEFDFRTGDSLSTALSVQMYTLAGSAIMATSQVAGQVAADTLYHLAFTYIRASALLTVYRNGVQMSQDTDAAGGNNTANGTSALQIGRRADAAGTTLDGQIGYVGIYPTALSAARIAAHYTAGIRGTR